MNSKYFSLTLFILMIIISNQCNANVAGSKHDFRKKNWSNGELCVTCHSPHTTQNSPAPLWNHTLSTRTYRIYSSSTLNATLSQPGGDSKLCLSCHDGSVAVSAFHGSSANGSGGGGTEFLRMKGHFFEDHPISFTLIANLQPLTKASMTL